MVKNQFLDTLPTVAFVKLVYNKLCNYFQISYGEGVYITHNFNFNQFCKTYKFNTILAYNALQFLDRTSVINLSKQYNRQTLVRFIVSNTSLFTYLEKHQNSSIVIKSILRTYGGAFDQEVKINTTLIADKASTSEESVFKILEQLEKDQIITLSASKTDAQITFILPREDDKTINVIASILEQQNKVKKKHVASVIDYIRNDKRCKSIQLLNYFGEKNVDACGICSVCILDKKSKKPEDKHIKNAIINLLENGDLSSRLLSEKLPFAEKDINSMIQLLLEHHIITITKTNTYKLAHI